MRHAAAEANAARQADNLHAVEHGVWRSGEGDNSIQILGVPFDGLLCHSASFICVTGATTRAVAHEHSPAGAQPWDHLKAPQHRFYERCRWVGGDW